MKDGVHDFIGLITNMRAIAYIFFKILRNEQQIFQTTIEKHNTCTYRRPFAKINQLEIKHEIEFSGYKIHVFGLDCITL